MRARTHVHACMRVHSECTYQLKPEREDLFAHLVQPHSLQWICKSLNGLNNGVTITAVPITSIPGCSSPSGLSTTTIAKHIRRQSGRRTTALSLKLSSCHSRRQWAAINHGRGTAHDCTKSGQAPIIGCLSQTRTTIGATIGPQKKRSRRMLQQECRLHPTRSHALPLRPLRRPQSHALHVLQALVLCTLKALLHAHRALQALRALKLESLQPMTLCFSRCRCSSSSCIKIPCKTCSLSCRINTKRRSGCSMSCRRQSDLRRQCTPSIGV